jgi:hypothetical protein
MKTHGIRRRTSRQRGFALIFVMISLALISLLALGMSLSSITELNVTDSTRINAEAFNTAESGLAHGIQIVKHMRGDPSNLLRGLDGILHSGDEFQDWGTNLVPPIRVCLGADSSLNLGTMFLTTGANAVLAIPGTIVRGASDTIPRKRTIMRMDARHFYELNVYDDADDPKAFLPDQPSEVSGDTCHDPATDANGRLLLRSTGYVMRADVPDVASFDFRNVIGTATLDAVIGLAPYPAVVSDWDLLLTGTAAVTGPLGAVHANDDLGISSSNIYVEATATWTDKVQNDTAPLTAQVNQVLTIAGGHPSILGHENEIPVPDLNPLDYGAISDLVFIDKNASVADKNSVLLGMFANLGAAAPQISMVSGIFGSAARLTLPLPIGGSITLPNVSLTNLVFQKVLVAGIPMWNVYDMASPLTPDFGIHPNGSSGDWRVDLGTAGGATEALGKTYTMVLAPGTYSGATVQFAGSTASRYISVLTNGSLRMDGNTTFNPKASIPVSIMPSWAPLKVVAMAGVDVVMRGTSPSGPLVSNGLVYAHEQFDVAGSVVMKGQILSKNLSLYSAVSGSANLSGSPVNGTASTVSGTVRVDIGNPLGNVCGYRIHSWRMLRDFNPQDA